MSGMSVTAIIPSVNFSDFLKITIPNNIKEIDKIIVTTDLNDNKTFDLCSQYNITCFKTDCFYKFHKKIDKKIFNRSLVINLTLQELHKKELDWILILDSDIILPIDFKNKVLSLNLNKEKFYGCRRLNIDNYQDYLDYKSGIKNDNDFYLFRGSGYGYFQLFNIQSVTYKYLYNNMYGGFPYPMTSYNVCEDDWKFRNIWGERVFNPPLGKFPECHLEKNSDYDTGLYQELPFNIIHLGSVGINHSERVAPEFK